MPLLLLPLQACEGCRVGSGRVGSGRVRLGWVELGFMGRPSRSVGACITVTYTLFDATHQNANKKRRVQRNTQNYIFENSISLLLNSHLQGQQARPKVAHVELGQRAQRPNGHVQPLRLRHRLQTRLQLAKKKEGAQTVNVSTTAASWLTKNRPPWYMLFGYFEVYVAVGCMS